MNLNLYIFSLSSKCLLKKIEKKSYYEKLRDLVKILFDGLALGNYILNNIAKSTIESLKGLESVQLQQLAPSDVIVVLVSLSLTLNILRTLF